MAFIENVTPQVNQIKKWFEFEFKNIRNDNNTRTSGILAQFISDEAFNSLDGICK
jgi:hypothetical protein